MDDRQLKKYLLTDEGKNTVVFFYRMSREEHDIDKLFGPRSKKLSGSKISWNMVKDLEFDEKFLNTWIKKSIKRIVEYDNATYKFELNQLVKLKNKSYDELEQKQKTSLSKCGGRQTIWRVIQHTTDGMYDLHANENSTEVITCEEDEIENIKQYSLGGKAARKRVRTNVGTSPSKRQRKPYHKPNVGRGEGRDGKPIDGNMADKPKSPFHLGFES